MKCQFIVQRDEVLRTEIKNMFCVYISGFEYVWFIIRKLKFKYVRQLLINPSKKKRRLLHLMTQVVPRSKHFSSRL